MVWAAAAKPLGRKVGPYVAKKVGEKAAKAASGMAAAAATGAAIGAASASSSGGSGSPPSSYTPSSGTVGGPSIATRFRGQATHGDEIPAIFWLILGLLITFFDVFWTRFSGINGSYFMNYIFNDPLGFVMKYCFNLILIGVFLFIMFYRGNWNPKEALSLYIFLFICQIPLYFAQGSVGMYLRIPFYLFVYNALIVPNAGDIRKARMQMAVMILIDFFGASTFNYLLGTSAAGTAFARLNFHIIPVWFFAMLSFTKGMDSRKSTSCKILSWFVIFLLIAGTITQFVGAVNMSTSIAAYEQEQFRNFYSDAFENIKKAYVGTKEGVAQAWNESKNAYLYQEEFYTGEIDHNAKQDLGVEIDKIEFGRGELYADEPIDLWATLVVNQLETATGSQETITVNTSCIVDKHDLEKKKSADVVRPDSFVAVESDEMPIDCMFRSNFFSPGTANIYLGAQFNFMTQAYQKVYFINKDTSLALRREGLDPLDNYGITDKDPKTIYTNGPVNIGMQFRQSPVPIDTSEVASYDIHMLGITVTNQWDGKLLKIKSFEFTLPAGMKLSETKTPSTSGEVSSPYECSGFKFSCAAGENDATVCTLIDPSKITEIESYKTFRCPVELANKDRILGESPISILYFRANVEYDYEIEKYTTLRIKESPEMAKIRSETKATKPSLSPLVAEMKQGETRTVDLLSLHEDKIPIDKETPDRYLYFEIVSQSSPEVAECELYGNNQLVCDSKNQDGIAEVVIQVSDLYHKVRQTVTLYVGQTSLPASDTESDLLKQAIEAINVYPSGADKVFNKQVYFKNHESVSLSFTKNDFVYETSSNNDYQIKAKKTNFDCLEDYEFRFIATGETGSETLHIPINMVCSECNNYCNCDTAGLCEASKAGCEWDVSCHPKS